MSCPIKTLQNTITQLSPQIPKPTQFGDITWLRSKEEVFVIFSKLKEYQNFESISSDNTYDFRFKRPVSITGMRIGNFLLSEFGEGNHCFIQPAIYAIDRIVTVAVNEAKDYNTLIQNLEASRKILRSREFFYGPFELGILDRFPERVDMIISDYDSATHRYQQKLCPAFSFMDEICNSVFPHYIEFWKKEQLRTVAPKL